MSFPRSAYLEVGENYTKIDRPRPSLLVSPHAALCKPPQGPAQLRLSLAQAAPPRLRQLPDEFMSNRYEPRKRALEVMGNFTLAASLDERMRLTLGIFSATPESRATLRPVAD